MQLLMTFMMALAMSGVMGFLNAGPDFLTHWPLAFAIAWPVAFLISSVVSPIALKLAHRIAPPVKA